MPAMRLSGRCGILDGTQPTVRRSRQSHTTSSWNLPTRSFRPARATAITSPPLFCLLARKLGYLASPIVGECGYSWNWYPIAHGWVEIELDGETFLFDPQIENYNLRAGISNETHSAWQVTYESAPARYLKH